MPLVEEEFTWAKLQSVRDGVSQGKTQAENQRRGNHRAAGPVFNRKVVSSPTHAQPDTHDPQKLPGPQIERSHLVQWNACGNEAHHEAAHSAAKAKLCK